MMQPVRSPSSLALAGGFALLLLVLVAQPSLADRLDVAKDEDGGPVFSRPQAASEHAKQGPIRYFVELTSAPLLELGERASIALEREGFLKSSVARAAVSRVDFNYSRVFAGMAVRVPDEASAESLLSLASVKAIHRVGHSTPARVTVGQLAGQLSAHGRALLQQQQAPTAKQYPLPTILEIGADIAHSKGYNGTGVKIGIIDSGVDYTHPDLGGCFGPGCKVAGGYDFVGDAYKGETAMVGKPDSDPMDCAGHGTHVAGIIAASGRLVGVAPGATLYAYKVFGCSGGVSDEYILAALERASADQVDIVNLSLGEPKAASPDYPLSAVVSRMARGRSSALSHGSIPPIVMSVSAGNDGPLGLFTGMAPGMGKGAISVASADSSVSLMPTFLVNGSSAPIPYLTYDTDFVVAPPRAGTFELAVSPTFNNSPPPGVPPPINNDSCTPFEAGTSLAGKVVLVRRGVCCQNVKADNAGKAGAAAVLMVNDGPLPPYMPVCAATKVPLAAISLADGERLASLVAAGPVQLTWTDDWLTLGNRPGGGTISTFSSYGLAGDLSLKPDITSPGGGIWSTSPLAKQGGGYVHLSGTSMAAPHVAGSCALLLQAKPTLARTKVLGAIQASAQPLLFRLNASLGLEPVHRQGAGMIRIDRAIASMHISVSPSSLSLGERRAGSVRTVTLTLRNRASTAVTFALSHQPAIATGSSTIKVTFHNVAAGVKFAEPNVRVRGRSHASFRVHITAPATLPDFGIFGGYIVMTGDSGAVLRVPYAGFNGDYQAMPYLLPELSSPGFQGLPKIIGPGSFDGVPAGTVFNLSSTPSGSLNQPRLFANVAVQPKEMRVEILDAVTERNMGWAYSFRHDEGFYPAKLSGYVELPIDGTVTTTSAISKVPYRANLPDGKYVVRIKVLKMGGSWSKAGQFEVKQTLPFEIRRA